MPGQIKCHHRALVLEQCLDQMVVYSHVIIISMHHEHRRFGAHRDKGVQHNIETRHMSFTHVSRHTGILIFKIYFVETPIFL